MYVIPSLSILRGARGEPLARLGERGTVGVLKNSRIVVNPSIFHARGKIETGLFQHPHSHLFSHSATIPVPTPGALLRAIGRLDPASPNFHGPRCLETGARIGAPDRLADGLKHLVQQSHAGVNDGLQRLGDEF